MEQYQHRPETMSSLDDDESSIIQYSKYEYVIA